MPADTSSKKRDVAIWYVFFALVGLLLVQWAWGALSQVETIPYSQFEQLVTNNQITTVAVGTDSIQGALKAPLPSGKTQFVTARVDAAMAEQLAAHGIAVTGVPSGGLIAVNAGRIPGQRGGVKAGQ